MHFSKIAGPLALAAGANAWNKTASYTTEVVTSFTTYCPEATSLIHNGRTYTVTEATTLTITDCPCTLTHPVVEPSKAPIATFSTSVKLAVSAVIAPSSPAISSVVESASPHASANIHASVAALSSVTSVVVASPTADVTVPPAAAVSIAPPAIVAPYPTSAPAPAGIVRGSAAPIGTASSVPSSPITPIQPSTSPFTGEGNKLAMSGAGLAAIVGLAVCLL